MKPEEKIVREAVDSAFCDINDARVKYTHNQAVDLIVEYVMAALSPPSEGLKDDKSQEDTHGG